MRTIRRIRRMLDVGPRRMLADKLADRRWQIRQSETARYLLALADSPSADALDPDQALAEDRRFWSAAYGASGRYLIAHLLNRRHPVLLWSPSDRATRVARFKSDTPDTAQACIKAADACCANDFSAIVPGIAAMPNGVRWLSLIDADGLWPEIPTADYLTLDSRLDLPADPRRVWELNRFQHAPILAAAYLLTKDPCYARAFQTQLDAWIEQNRPGIGINWLQAQECVLRASALAVGFALFADAPAFDDAFRLRWLAVIAQNGDAAFHGLSDAPLTHNHLMTECAHLAALGVLFPEFKHARRWRETAERLLAREMDRQIQADGLHAEQALPYHFFVMESLTFLAAIDKLLRRVPLPKLHETVARMANAGERFVRRDGTVWPIGDNDDGRGLRVPGAIDQGRTGWLALAKQFGDQQAADTPECFWLGPEHATQTESQTADNRPLRVFEDGGYAQLSHANTNLVFRIGPIRHAENVATNHLHADFLSVCLEHDGRVLLDDPGVFRYNPNLTERIAFRQTRVHTAPQVDDGDALDVSTQRFGVGPLPTVELLHARWDGELAHLAARHNGYGPQAWLRRDLIAWPGRLLWLIDSFTPEDIRAHRLTANYLSPLAVSADTHSVSLTDDAEILGMLRLPADQRVRFISPDDDGCSEPVLRAPRYGLHETAGDIRATREGKGTLELVTLVLLDPALFDGPMRVAMNGGKFTLFAGGRIVELSTDSLRWRDA